ncbi:hypothetical protein BKE30_02255 [Alkanindiges hydrocarboniclasticus]|uniref:Uncharacterized protein n=1 Tax=Alkanindiges hydrocarboniclasticus TaxID=1907941 RepID=A0A1S8CY09_9GAMM|nr:hypothetical protein [Alkanindiges hydrocarboniclasticus]ONG41926.1 hypothetical protein BKE30_02255 [Alkanindiges hydrocarboniclasticus]
MSQSLSFQDVLIGIAIFAVEFLKVAALRFAFIIYVMFISLLFFPLMAGWIINLLILTIPISYFLFGVPALMLGFSVSLFMIMSRSYIQKSGFAHVVLGVMFAPLMIWLFYNWSDPDSFARYVADFINNPLSFNPGNYEGHSLWFINIYFLFGAIFAGGVIGGLSQTKISKKLLAPPTSVRYQLMMFKKKYNF